MGRVHGKDGVEGIGVNHIDFPLVAHGTAELLHCLIIRVGSAQHGRKRMFAEDVHPRAQLLVSRSQRTIRHAGDHWLDGAAPRQLAGDFILNQRGAGVVEKVAEDAGAELANRGPEDAPG